jgi:hypothetical protein
MPDYKLFDFDYGTKLRGKNRLKQVSVLILCKILVKYAKKPLNV